MLKEKGVKDQGLRTCGNDPTEKKNCMWKYAAKANTCDKWKADSYECIDLITAWIPYIKLLITVLLH